MLWEQITKGAIFPLSFSARPLLRSWQLSELSRCPREIWEGTEAAWHARGWHCLWIPWCCQCHQPWGQWWP